MKISSSFDPEDLDLLVDRLATSTVYAFEYLGVVPGSDVSTKTDVELELDRRVLDAAHRREMERAPDPAELAWSIAGIAGSAIGIGLSAAAGPVSLIVIAGYAVAGGLGVGSAIATGRLIEREVDSGHRLRAVVNAQALLGIVLEARRSGGGAQ